MKNRTFAIFTIAIVGLAVLAVASGFDPAQAIIGGGLGLQMITAAPAAAAVAVDPPAATEEDWNALKAELKTAIDEVKRFAAESDKALKATSTLGTDLKADIDKALSNMTKLAAQVGDIEQKLAGRSGTKPASSHAQTAGRLFVADEGPSKFKAGTRGTWRVEIPHEALAMGTNIMRADISSLDASAGKLVEEMRIPGIQMLPQRRLTIRNLVSPGQTTSSSFKYVRELVFTNAARTVTEGALKPQSELTFEDEVGDVVTIAHWMRANNQIVDDAPGLRSIIDARLRYGLELAEELELLRGDGSANHLEGLVTAATAYSAPLTIANPTRIDTIRLAMLQVTLSDFMPDGIVMNPIDWTGIELTKTTDGAYLMSNPASGNLNRRLWGLPVVDTQAMEEDEFMVGGFKMAAQIFDRENAAVEVSTEDGDNFRTNRVTIRAEERLALAIYRPTALIVGDFGLVT